MTGWTQVDSFVNGTIKSTLWQKTATSEDLGKTVRVDDPTGYRLGVLSVVAYTGVDPAGAGCGGHDRATARPQRTCHRR